MTKIMTILGTRPEIIKMSCLIRELDDRGIIYWFTQDKITIMS